jgi:hypothetical protein
MGLSFLGFISFAVLSFGVRITTICISAQGFSHVTAKQFVSLYPDFP